MRQKTLVDLVEILLAKKRAWNVDTNLKIAVGNTEVGTIAVTGKSSLFLQRRKEPLQNSSEVLITYPQHS
jgi:hypothetical protein